MADPQTSGRADMADRLVARGIAKNRSQANLMLIGLAIAAFVIAGIVVSAARVVPPPAQTPASPTWPKNNAKPAAPIPDPLNM